MKRGTIAILLILTVAMAAAGFTVWYHYKNQYRAQKFWGGSTAQLIDKAPQAEVLQIGPVGSGGVAAAVEAAEDAAAQAAEETAAEKKAPEEKPADEGAKPAGEAEPPAEEPAAATKAVEFDDRVWAITASRPALGAKGISNLRRALVLDTTFDWDQEEAGAAEPTWHYALTVNDGKNSATVLFDFDTRRVALAGGRRMALLNQMANDDIRSFFEEQFVEAKDKPAADKPAAANSTEAQPAETEKAPAGS